MEARGPRCGMQIFSAIRQWRAVCSTAVTLNEERMVRHKLRRCPRASGASSREGRVTRSADGLEWPRELGAPRIYVKAMKREHDTEPGTRDLTDDMNAPSRAEPRHVTARGLGQPIARSSLPTAGTKNDSVDFTSDTEIEDPPEVGAPRFTNDSIDDGISAIGDRRHIFPVSLEAGQSHHVSARLPPSSNDTLPPLGKVVVDTPTDPGGRHRDARAPREEPALLPALLPKRRLSRRALVAIMTTALLLLVGTVSVVAIRERDPATLSPVMPSTAPSVSPRATSLTSSQAAIPTNAPPLSVLSASSAMSPERPPPMNASKAARPQTNPKPDAVDKKSDVPASSDIERITPY
jgi:hypothetical protein